MTDSKEALRAALSSRFSDAPAPGDEIPAEALGLLSRMAGRGSVRRFQDRPVEPALMDTLAAVALSSPTKSDLQQRDIVVVEDPAIRAAIDALVSGQAWVAGAPAFLVFCGNNRRQRLLHEMRGRPFANDHLDAFFNAAADAAIALCAFVTAAEAVGLGTCPVSAVRNEAQAVSDLLGLPEHVFPLAGLALGWPAEPAEISPRLPLALTLHRNRFSEREVTEKIAAYDAARRKVQPYDKQRFEAEDGTDPAYGWAEDKARQYARAERAGFGDFVRRKGFRLD